MFKCEATGKITQPGEKQNKVVVESRQVVYTAPPKKRRDEPRQIEGRETVKEVALCNEAKRLWDEGRLIYENGRFHMLDSE